MPATSVNTNIKEFPVTETLEKNTAELAISLNAHDMANAIVNDKFDVIEALGVIKAASFYATVSEKLLAETAINIRDSKKYKGLIGKDQNGNPKQVSGFEEFCEVFLGKSARRVQQLMSNYNQLGPDLYEQAELIGFRQRDYNALKALPADDRLIIAQAIESEDLDKALDLMQQLAAKHQREKEASLKQVELLRGDLVAKDTVIGEYNESLTKKTNRIQVLEAEKRTTIDEVRMPGEFQLMRLQEYSRELTVKVTATLNSEIAKLYQVFDGQPPMHIELAARQAVGLIITAAYGVADNMGFVPILDAEQAADEPGRAEAKAFEEYIAQQNSDLIDESNQFDTESADDWTARENINTEPAAEA